MIPSAINNVLGFKTISWDPINNKFISPARPEFIWSDQGLQVAFCKKAEHKAPDEFCTCGIYATYRVDIAKGYERRELNVLLLVEAGGKTIIHTEGWRAEETRLLAAVLYSNNSNQKLCMYQASDYYGIPTMKIGEAIMVMDIFNSHLLPYYKPINITRDEAIQYWRKTHEITSQAT